MKWIDSLIETMNVFKQIFMHSVAYFNNYNKHICWLTVILSLLYFRRYFSRCRGYFSRCREYFKGLWKQGNQERGHTSAKADVDSSACKYCPVSPAQSVWSFYLSGISLVILLAKNNLHTNIGTQDIQTLTFWMRVGGRWRSYLLTVVCWT